MARVFNVGDYKNKITFIERTEGQDDYGELIDIWKSFKTTWASKEPILGKEFYASLTTDNKVEVKFNMRYLKGVTSEMRIQHGSNIYEIIGPPVDVKSTHKELLCYCRQVRE